MLRKKGLEKSQISRKQEKVQLNQLPVARGGTIPRNQLAYPKQETRQKVFHQDIKSRWYNGKIYG